MNIKILVCSALLLSIHHLSGAQIPLIGAASQGDGTQVIKLLKEGHNSSATVNPWLNGGGNTALHYLAQFSTEEAQAGVEALLKDGAPQEKNKQGKTPFDLASARMKPLLSPPSQEGDQP
jgi:hypothetical protein